MKKEKKSINKELVVDLFVVAIILSGLMPIVTVTAQQTVVSIPDASANTCETVTVPINITNAAGLGAVTIWLSYNNSVVIVDAISDGNLGSIIAGIDNTSGVTKMSWFSATGETGDFAFAYVTLNATGSAEDTSELNLTVKKLVDTGNNPIAHTVDEGMFTASGPQPTPTSTPSPTPSLTPEVTPTPTPSETETPSPSLSPTSMPAVTPTATPTVTPAPSPTPAPTPPGFEAVFAIAGLLAVAYLVLRGKRK